MPIPPYIKLAAGQLVMVEFGPDPRDIAPPGVMHGPLSVMPEMFKQRPGIVVATTKGLSTVVPLSTDAPLTPKPFHLRIVAGTYDGLSTTQDSWTKSDLLTTVSNERLDRVSVGGRRATVIINPSDLKAVRATVLNALQLGRLTSYL